MIAKPWTWRFPPSFQTALIVGDAAVFLLFAGLGRDQHHESGGPFSVVVTAAPFVAAWCAVAAPSGVLSRAWLGLGRRAMRNVGLAWLAAWPIGLALRAAGQGRGIPLSFDLVALIVNGLFLLGWRAAYLFVARRARFIKPPVKTGWEDSIRLKPGVRSGNPNTRL